MICLEFMQIYRGLLNSYFTGVLVLDCMKQRDDNEDNTVYKAQLGATIMMSLGAMEVIGAVVTGRLIKKFGKRFGLHFISAVGLICCLFMISLLSNNITFGWPYYIAAALWGFADSSLSTSLTPLVVICSLKIGDRV